MSDITTKLREWADHFDHSHATTNKRTAMSSTMIEAADEIERLRQKEADMLTAGATEMRGKPIAWIGVFDGEPDPEFIWWDEAKARRWINTRPGVKLAPLFLAPPLTDAEREAVETAAMEAEAHQHAERAATLRNLLLRQT